MTIYKPLVGPGRMTLIDPDTGLATEFSHQCTSITIEPSSEVGDTISVLCGEEEAGDTTESATISATLYQDRRLDGLVVWTWTNRQKRFELVVVFNDSDGVEWRGDVTVQPLTVGGDVKASGTSDLEWSYIGMPTPTALTEPPVHPAPAPV